MISQKLIKRTVDAANTVESPYKNLPKGKPRVQVGLPYQIEYENTKCKTILGLGTDIAFRTIQESTRDSLNDFASRGWGL
jgi:hypothetical protein